MVLITIVTGVYKPIYKWGAPHCMRCFNDIPILSEDSWNGNGTPWRQDGQFGGASAGWLGSKFWYSK
jgi:hypothetical protein